MKPQIVVDTNVLISFLTDRDQRQQELAGTLFREAAEGKCVLIPTFADASLAAIVTQGGYDEVATFDRRLIGRLKRQGLSSRG
jgi:predicted nucleic acid-binding protein